MSKTELLPFDSDLHEDLFKLMILASNDWIIKERELLVDYWTKYYHFQFNDRSIVEDQYVWCQWTGRFHSFS